MKRYEYKVDVIKIGRFGIFDDSGKQTKQLNAPGEDGWELVCISEGAKYMKYVYCRELAEGQKASKVSQSSSERAPASPTQRLISSIVLFCMAMALTIATLVLSKGSNKYAFIILGVDLFLMAATVVLFIFSKKNSKVGTAFVIVSSLSTVAFLASFMIGVLLINMVIAPVYTPTLS